MTELRRDPVTGNWVIVGHAIHPGNPTGVCPFCPGNEQLTPRAVRELLDNKGSWLIRDFPALNSVFLIEAEEDRRGEGLYDKMGNVGAHEIIVDHRSHTKTLATLTEREAVALFRFFAERIADLKGDKRFRYVHVFRNQGEISGSHLTHPHSHVLATPMIPRRVELELASARAHFARKERCLFCDVVRQELRQNVRIVNISSGFIAFCPFASRFPFEVWVVPRSHEAVFETLDPDAMSEFVVLLLDVIRRIDQVMPAHSLIIHTSPNMATWGRQGDDAAVADYFHWHAEILPKNFRVAKYKTEDEFYVTPGTPEEAAALLKRAVLP